VGAIPVTPAYARPFINGHRRTARGGRGNATILKAKTARVRLRASSCC